MGDIYYKFFRDSGTSNDYSKDVKGVYGASTPPYTSINCTDLGTFRDSKEIAGSMYRYDRELYLTDSGALSDDVRFNCDEIKVVLPEIVVDNSNVSVFSRAIENEAERVLYQFNTMDKLYNLEQVDSNLLDNVITMSGVNLPLYIEESNLRMYIDSFMRVRRERGIRKSIIAIVKMCGRKDNMSNPLSELEYNKVDVSVTEKGSFLIRCSYITDIDYLMKSLRKTLPAGYRCQYIDTTLTTQPYKMRESGEFTETAVITIS